MSRLIVIDNYDSFTYNLVQYFGELGELPEVYRNDALTLSQIQALNPAGIVISPGPGRPENAGVTLDIIRSFYTQIPVLGVCLGHQAMAQVLGAKITYAPKLMHGKTSLIYHDGHGIFSSIPTPFPGCTAGTKKCASSGRNQATSTEIFSWIRRKAWKFTGSG
jgi:anthranilate synthase/aminodeoxychorismate synthase-like glutamine amidotransferase